MCKAETLVGYMGRCVEALPVDKVKALLDKYLIK
jgi:D-aminopeptidase